MHELGITRNIVALVVEAADGRPVRRITVAVGKLSGVMADAVRFCFDVVAEGTPVHGAVLEVVEPEGRARCGRCAAEFAAPTLWSACACGSRDLTYVGGEELLVKTVEFAEVG
jgi:hydrogenase nickel incorporation protein HypA/HybF